MAKRPPRGPNDDADVRFFESAAAFRAWLTKHHKTATVCRVGYVRKAHAAKTGRATLTWAESVREALCFGWIDGVRHTLDDASYSVRFTPRRPTSRWSAVNIRLVAELEAAGRMKPAGRAAFDARPDKSSGGYTAQRKDAALDRGRLAAFKRHKGAWAFFEAQPPGYRRTMAWWVMQAKQEATRDKRLRRLIDESAAGRRVT